MKITPFGMSVRTQHHTRGQSIRWLGWKSSDDALLRVWQSNVIARAFTALCRLLCLSLCVGRKDSRCNPRVCLINEFEPSIYVHQGAFFDGRICNFVASDGSPNREICDRESVTHNMGAKRQMCIKFKQWPVNGLEVCREERSCSSHPFLYLYCCQHLQISPQPQHQPTNVSFLPCRKGYASTRTSMTFSDPYADVPVPTVISTVAFS